MIEVHLAQHGERWNVTATILPWGGLGIAKVAVLGTLEDGSFAAAAEVVNPLLEASFTPNPDRWPVPEPKIQVINEMSHPNHTIMGNYRILRAGKVIGRIADHPRAEMTRLIKDALKIASESERGSG